MHLPKLQYISDGRNYDEQYHNVLTALDAGVKWIQLRWKNADMSQIQRLAESIKIKCDIYEAIFIINDYPEIASKTDATGVHLGLNDMPVNEAKKILSPHQWIGGTANTLENVLQRISENVKYIGLGPFRFTFTKEKLSPVLGLDGYKKILSSISENTIPIYAIGGITEKDIEELISIGIYGVAISSAINKSIDKKSYIYQLNKLLYETI